ncbi:transposase [Dermacoccus nishinomiyaensis]
MTSLIHDLKNDGYVSVTNQMVRECRRLMERSSKVAHIERILAARPGRKRVHSVTTLLALYALAIDQSRATEAIIARTAEIADALTPSQRQMLGLTSSYHPDQLYRLNALIASLELDCDADGVVPDGSLPFTLNALATDIVNAAIPDQIRPTTTFAVDGTDIESWGNYFTAKRRREAGDDGRIPDPEASMGHRTASQNAKDMFYGHMAHLATDLPEFGFQGNHVPLIRAVAMASNAEGVTARAGLEAIDEVRDLMPVEHVIADRGYTFATADKWASPLAERGIRQTLDLHPAQVGPQPGPVNLPGTRFIDGGLFSDGMPDRLLRLKRVPRFQGAAEHVEHVATFDERSLYAFRRVSESKDIWYGPAYAGRERVRCPNWPTSMTKLDLPLTTCTADTPCSCGARKTVRDFDPRLAQRHLWGTSDWEADYGRRTFVESTNSFLKTQVGKITRGSIRVMGRAKMTLAVGIILAIINMRMIRSRYDIGLTDESIPDIPAAKPPRRKYAARYKQKAKPRTTNAPPPKRGDRSALPASMQPPTIAGRTTTQQ